MPNRFLKESICTSETIAQLSADEECLFYRIIVQCDDFGRMESHPQIIRTKCIPWKADSINNDKVEQWLNKLVKAGLIILYKINSKRYLQISTWSKHQQTRATHSKYPAPDSNLITSDNNSYQPITNVLVFDNDNDNDNDIYNTLFVFWNEKKIIVHEKLTADIKSAIKSVLKDYSADQVKTAITNYSIILKGDDYYWSHKWTMSEFLSRRKGNNIERFLDLETAKQNFRNKEVKNGVNKTNPRAVKKAGDYTSPEDFR
jgi:hypothetical protein